MRKNISLVFFDWIVLSILFFVAYNARVFFGGSTLQPFLFYIPLMVVAIISFLLLMIGYGLYDARTRLFSLAYLVRYLKVLGTWAGLLAVFAYVAKTDYSRLVVFLFINFAIIGLTVIRLFMVRGRRGVAKVLGDQEIIAIARDIIRLSQISPDQLQLLEGMHDRNTEFRLYDVWKRLFDVVVASTALVVVSPFFIVFIFLIRRDTSGPAFFSQKRIGRNGRTFMIYKFRTMHASTERYAPAPRSADDSRITRMGRWLRRYSLDELPQLWNVLKGDMSIVGPRPEMPFIVEAYEPWQHMRFKARPGITGLWQILGRKDLPLEKNLEYDIYYTLHYSFFLDMAIIIKTIPHVLWGSGAY